MTPMIRARGLTKTFHGDATKSPAVDAVDLDVQEGEFVTLLGPSGCGKTTTLRLVAGLEQPTAGSVEIDGVVVSDPARRLFVGAHRRHIGMVFQSYAIWPHMSVIENVMFPLKFARPRMTSSKAREKAMNSLEMVGLDGVAGRAATQLSGGQQQRVAVARALVSEPKVLLLDEPLSNLDASLRDRMRDEIRGLQQRLGITTVFVTHDQDEALAVSDRIVVMNHGRIVEQGSPQQIYNRPESAFTAKFLGISNEIRGMVRAVSDGQGELELETGPLTYPVGSAVEAGHLVTVFLRPENFDIDRAGQSSDRWSGEVEAAIYRGNCWDYDVRVRDSIVKVRVFAEKLGFERGERVFLRPRPAAAVVIPEPGDVDLQVADEVPGRLGDSAVKTLVQMPVSRLRVDSSSE